MSAPGPQAAVAIVEVGGGDPEILVVRRAGHDRDPWSGHLALPGGRRDAGDADLVETAIREAREECGIALGRESLIRSLPVTAAGRVTGGPLLVAPFVFRLAERPAIRLREGELDAFHWLTRSFLTDPARRREEELAPQFPGRSFPCIDVGGDRLWGFTYRVLMDYLGKAPGVV